MQSKKGSFFEAISNTIIGYVITLIFSPFLYGICGIEYRTSQLCIVTLLFTILSICRGYVIRRWFNKKNTKTIFTDEATVRLQYLEKLISNPEIENFIEGLRIESAHQTDKWGQREEESKWPQDYALVLDKLKGKQALAIWDYDKEKYKHHLITMSAVCHNIHRQIEKEGTALNQYFNTPKRK